MRTKRTTHPITSICSALTCIEYVCLINKKLLTLFRQLVVSKNICQHVLLLWYKLKKKVITIHVLKLTAKLNDLCETDVWFPPGRIFKP